MDRFISFSVGLLIALLVVASCGGEQKGQPHEAHSMQGGAMRPPEKVENYVAPRIAQDVVNPNRNGFDTICKTVKIEVSDRIVFPDIPPPVDGGHKHIFYCTNVEYNSTIQQMHTGTSNSTNRPEDKSGIWTMTVNRPDGTVLKPTVVKLYYRTAVPNPQVPIENLKAIAGDRLATAEQPQDTDITWWDCKDKSSGDVTGKWQEPHQCEQSDQKPRLRFTFPQCVENVGSDPSRQRVDSENHKDHLAYPVKKDGVVKCPDTHPIPIVRMGLQISYPAADEKNAANMDNVVYSSGGRYGAHADWWQTSQMSGYGGLKQTTERCFKPGVFCKLGYEPID